MTRIKASALLDHAAKVPAAIERSMTTISLEAMGNALVQADAGSDQLVRAANIANPAPVGLIHRVLKYQNADYSSKRLRW